MATETNVYTGDAFDQLKAQGAVRTEVVLIQHDPENDLFNCSLVARGYDASDNPLPEDKLLCPSPCKIGQAFNTGA